MYGTDCTCTAMQWLRLTGDPDALTAQDKREFGLHTLANANQQPTPPEERGGDTTYDR